MVGQVPDTDGVEVGVTAEEEFSVVFERHYRDVERYLYRRAPDVSVHDLAAEVFLVAWRRWERMPPDKTLPWLYAVAGNVLANEIRSRQRHRRLTDRVATFSPPPVAADHAEEVSERAAVAAAFDRLSEPDREVLRLIVWEQLKMADAARVLGCSTPAFAMRLARARRRLRATLEPSPSPPMANRIRAVPSTTGESS